MTRQRTQHVHFLGIGGSGLSPLAQIHLAGGGKVSGSDAEDSPRVATLRARGVPVRVGPAPAAEKIAAELAGVDVVVASSALAEDHPEIVAARSLGLAVRRRSEWLPELTAGYRLVAVAGSHGKSTTSAMLTLVLRAAGLDPTAVIGAEVSQLGGNALAGSGDLFVLESDEYGGAFAGLEPTIAVITNVEWEHPDIFPDEASVRTAFTAFARRVRPGGRLVVCGDDPGVAAVLAELHRQGTPAAAPVLDYGFGTDRRWRAVDVATVAGDDTARAVVLHGGQEIGTLTLAVPGRHSLLNALAVLAVATELGVAPAQTLATLATYTGAARRFEFVGFWRAGTPDPAVPAAAGAAAAPPVRRDPATAAAAATTAPIGPPDSPPPTGIALPRAAPPAVDAPVAATPAPAAGPDHAAALPAPAGALASRSPTGPATAVADPVGEWSLEIIDDYAHHPTEIRLTLAAARARTHGRALWAVLQPHTYSRFAALLDGFATAFADADRVYVTDIYAARETDDLGRHPTDLVERLVGPAVVGYVPWPELVDRLAADVRDTLSGPVPAQAGGILLLTLGAGTITTVGPRLLAALDEPAAG
ncbi:MULTISPECIES: UDP-N-acetylmuramate--L-alanine ligase [Frankia]|uniref:UDP-N-acetylmuramate--L-alanine ligase n=1 Tax=Frankia alni (strain DSM 45986 / CECT 9034 / ACN14a) TaxID=326424 RepID=MURC_FRAAA|nr:MULTISPECIES: UDP-N-acetylmuramate--L-alanine ligase [Frankia]Q0RNN9.1 RecName: Full=UDP-N-acetylmuramate--L-alanine ligase; AltName: Full=UDP-N-acetylmuramoyl-L-alanine synthetase [Frankia alni ACN14a]CAJ60847.1 UDP-N-acetylmuramate--L-alanine ligase [Frankia alni ACN14a]